MKMDNSLSGVEPDNSQPCYPQLRECRGNGTGSVLYPSLYKITWRMISDELPYINRSGLIQLQSIIE